MPADLTWLLRWCEDEPMSSTGAGDLTPEAWLAAFAERLGLPAPDPADVEVLLALAGTAAHASARTAAPIACYLVGRAGIDLDTAATLAAAIGDARR